jgi:hypothetical protein
MSETAFVAARDDEHGVPICPILLLIVRSSRPVRQDHLFCQGLCCCILR